MARTRVKIGERRAQAKKGQGTQLVPVYYCREISRNKYSGADLRKLRAERGIGRPPEKL